MNVYILYIAMNDILLKGNNSDESVN